MSQTNPRPTGFFGRPDNRCFILEVSFECDVCEKDTPARDGRRARLDGPFGSATVDLCPACYRDGIEDEIIEALPTNR